jgi:hypothetical protein
MEKYGKENLNPLLFNGFKNYNKQPEEITNAIQSVFMYLKMCSDIYYFEHNVFETDDYDLDNQKVYVKMDWVVFGLEKVLDRTPSQESEQNDLVVAIDVFQDGISKLRIHYPDWYKDKFEQHYKQFNGQQGNSLFSTHEEENYVKLIEDIITLI